MRVEDTSVNAVDWKIRRGYLQGAYPHHLPIIPGWDVSASPENHDLLRSLGVSEVVDYHEGRFSEQLSAPVNAVLDTVGGSAWRMRRAR